MAQIIRASHLGFCFGVRDALAVAADDEHPEQTVVYGELVHNRDVTDWLHARQFETVSETQRDEIPQRDRVLITAHGISDKRRQSLLAAGKQLIDTTCPLVGRVHDTARKLVQADYHVIVIGRHDHVEVQGITEDLPDGGWNVVQTPASVGRYDATRIGIVCQTTMPGDIAEACRDEITRQNPQATIRWINTICRPTRQRQSAVDTLCDSVDVVVVVGGSNSNNTRRLTQRCRMRGVLAYQVQSARELQRKWFQDVTSIGLTAGTSTPDTTIDAVENRIRELTTPE